MLSAHPATAWNEVLERIEKCTTPQQFATWFRGLAAASISSDKVELSVPNRFHRDWIATYYLPIVEAAVAEVLGEALPVRVVVGSAPSRSPKERPEATGPRASPGEGEATPKPARDAPASGPASLPLTACFDFDRFVVGPCNQLAAVAGRAFAADVAPPLSNLIVFLGPTGIGKTHLLQAMVRAAARPSRRVAYVRGETFINEYVTACASGSEAAARFRSRWRDLDLVCFDDLHLLAGKSGSQAELLHTLNAWCDRGARVAFAATTSSGDALHLDPTLLARLSGAHRIGVRPPDRETRRALVAAKALDRGARLPDDVAEFLADLPAANVRELEGALTSVLAMSRLLDTPITLPAARAALQDSSLLARPTSSPDRVIKLTCEHFEVSPSDLYSPRRPQALAFARQVAMFLLRERTELSLAEIGAALGGRDHTTVLHGIRRIEDASRTDSRVLDRLSRIRHLLDR